METNNFFFKSVLDNIFEGVYAIDLKGHVIYWNNSATRITKFTEEEMMNKSCCGEIIHHLDHRGEKLCGTKYCLKAVATHTDKEYTGDFFIQSKEGEIIPILCKYKPLKNINDEIIGTLFIFLDNSLVGDERERLVELEKLTLLDPLTEIGNRRFGEINLTNAMQKFNRYGHLFGLLFIDIDHFKNVNDIYGHKTGDNILKMVSLVLKYSMRSFDVAARWGGEEFIAIIHDIDQNGLKEVAERTRKLIGHAHVIHNKAPVKVTASIGATIVQQGDTVESILIRADKAMYESKEQGRNRVTGAFAPINI
jgi:diguanylate cyclase (GGDEF)-like protein/PAS domain S-box-containing protein